MSISIKQVGRSLVYILVTNGIYGVILYFVFTWLAGFSMLWAYLGNLALIVFGLAVDEYMQRLFQTKEFAAEIKREKDKGKSVGYMLWLIDNFVSFKTALYLFYVFILIFSQIVSLNPGLVSENIGNFVLANNYSILFLIAFDMVMRQFAKDRERMGKTSAELKRIMDEGDEEAGEKTGEE